MHRAVNVVDHNAFAVRAEQVAVVGKLNARLPHFIAALVVEIVRLALKLRVGHRAGVADDLARQPFVGIHPACALLHHNARKRVPMLRYERHIAGTGIGGNLALGLRAAARIQNALAHHGIRKAGEHRETHKHARSSATSGLARIVGVISLSTITMPSVSKMRPRGAEVFTVVSWFSSDFARYSSEESTCMLHSLAVRLPKMPAINTKIAV